jgi:hypothetical protein
VNPLPEGRSVLHLCGLILGLSLFSYYVRELLVCWLFFMLTFTSIAVLVGASLLVYHAGRSVVHWAGRFLNEPENYYTS